MDRYTKIVLTFIAIGLFANAGTSLIPSAKAGNGVQDVRLVDVDYYAFLQLYPLKVECTNCD